MPEDLPQSRSVVCPGCGRVVAVEARRCRGCGRIYWRGSHFEKLQALIEQVL